MFVIKDGARRAEDGKTRIPRSPSTVLRQPEKYNSGLMRTLPIRAGFLLVFAGFLVPGLTAQHETPPAHAPAPPGLDAKRLDEIPPLVEAAIEEKKLPGAVVLVG